MPLADRRSPLASAPARARRRRLRSGFTLVELMMALMAGTFVATAAFMLARQASELFQHEARISSAQFGVSMGVARLEADLQRAGFLSSANVKKDPLRCGAMGDWPDGLAELAAVTVEDGGSVARHGGDHALTLENGLSPDALIIGGAVATTEQFAVRGVFTGAGGGKDIVFEVRSGPYQRTVHATGCSQSLDQVFKVGRFMRIVDAEGRASYGVITAVDPTEPEPRVTLAAPPVIPTKDTGSPCGPAGGFATGTLVNPIARVLYDIRAVDDAQYPRYAGLYAKARHGQVGAHKGLAEPARTELVRVELDAAGAELDETLEVVAEYAVDLKVGLSVATPGNNPVVTRIPIGGPGVYATAAPLSQGGTPERIRGVAIRLSTRAAVRDRDVAIPAPSEGGLFRFGLGQNAGFARMRTLTTDVALPNLVGVTW